MNPKEHSQIEKQLNLEAEKQRQLALNKQRAREILLSIKFSLATNEVANISTKKKYG